VNPGPIACTSNFWVLLGHKIRLSYPNHPEVCFL
jgi:hypothetical protein